MIAVPLRVAHIGVWCAAEDLVEGEDRAEGLPVEDEATDPEGLARELNVCSPGAIDSARREGERHLLERRERRRAKWAVEGDLTSQWVRVIVKESLDGVSGMIRIPDEAG